MSFDAMQLQTEPSVVNQRAGLDVKRLTAGGVKAVKRCHEDEHVT